MIERTLDVTYDKLIIGSTLSALFYSYNNNIPFIWIRQNKPKLYIDRSYKENIVIYENLFFLLSLAGLTPFGNFIYSIRLEEELLKLTTTNGLVIKIYYNNLYIFDDHKLEGLPPPKPKTYTENIVLDWFDINSGNSHNIDKIITQDKFLKEANFYTSNRFVFQTYSKKDCCCVSYITDSELEQFEFSQTYCGFKLKKLMKDNGIKGRFDKTNNTHKLVQISHNKREIIPVAKNIYEDFNTKISFKNEDIILEENKKIKSLGHKFGINI